jgi:UDP-glucose 4-epimerase
MKAHNCFQLVFSSSCCVYGNPERLPITEDSPIGNVTNVYGRTKYIIEEMLMDLSRSDDVIVDTQIALKLTNFYFFN